MNGIIMILFGIKFFLSIIYFRESFIFLKKLLYFSISITFSFGAPYGPIPLLDASWFSVVPVMCL